MRGTCCPHRDVCLKVKIAPMAHSGQQVSVSWPSRTFLPFFSRLQRRSSACVSSPEACFARRLFHEAVADGQRYMGQS